MKKLKIIYAFVVLSAFFFAGCDKEDTEGLSRITYFPTFEMAGDEFMSLVQGETYTEPGVTATEEGTEIEVTTTGTVDTSTPGVYEIVYSATNKDGFSGTVTRTVAVLPEAEQEGVDISGKYANTGSFAYVADVVKLAPGFYRSSNIWGGGSAAIIPAYIVTTDGTNLVLPTSALSGYGRVEGTGTLNDAGLMELSVSLLDQGLANSARKWQKQ
ncbi:immunoglobulin-like domain-containing protein [Pontibacter russatus]|uniref:immunoglobulin-like domain-containing protein n=1 Tax=Pontibacter russatus TaxID=2694929 RepID=UPI001379CC00|nr:immunoglobulin-like domain-containing protein [Pontibacter russatus]